MPETLRRAPAPPPDDHFTEKTERSTRKNHSDQLNTAQVLLTKGDEKALAS